MGTDLSTYAAVLLTGTGTSVSELEALLHTDQSPPTPAAAAVVDGWNSADDEGEDRA